jgi:peptide/nickel transport system substrate-binding protein
MMLGKMNGHFRLMLAGAALSAMVFAAPALAATPADTLVQAWAIDDTITLDPAESFELSPAEFLGNAYDMLVRLDINDTTKVRPGVAESWTVSDDGLTYTFKLKSGLKFASGNPITAKDVAWSFERVVKLDKSPAFILTQFGLTKDNVTEKAKAADDSTFVFTVDKSYAPSFVLNCLTATVGAVIDKQAGARACRSCYTDRRVQVRHRLRQWLAEDRLRRLRSVQDPRLARQRDPRARGATTTITATSRRLPASSTATSRKARPSA